MQLTEHAWMVTVTDRAFSEKSHARICLSHCFVNDVLYLFLKERIIVVFIWRHIIERYVLARDKMLIKAISYQVTRVPVISEICDL